MTIQDLLDRAHSIDPGMTFSAYDRWDYEPGQPEGRETILHAWGPSGSREGITLAMKGDQVEGIIPGRTMYHWQAEPVVLAYDSLKRDEAEGLT